MMDSRASKRRSRQVSGPVGDRYSCSGCPLGCGPVTILTLTQKAGASLIVCLVSSQGGPKMARRPMSSTGCLQPCYCCYQAPYTPPHGHGDHRRAGT